MKSCWRLQPRTVLGSIGVLQSYFSRSTISFQISMCLFDLIIVVFVCFFVCLRVCHPGAIRKVTCTLSITKSSKALQNRPRKGRLATMYIPWGYFTLRILEIWCLLPYSFSNNQVKPTQYGLQTTQNMIGCWRRCGFDTQTIKCSRFVIPLQSIVLR